MEKTPQGFGMPVGEQNSRERVIDGGEEDNYQGDKAPGGGTAALAPRGVQPPFSLASVASRTIREFPVGNPIQKGGATCVANVLFPVFSWRRWPPRAWPPQTWHRPGGVGILLTAMAGTTVMPIGNIPAGTMGTVIRGMVIGGMGTAAITTDPDTIMATGMGIGTTVIALSMVTRPISVVRPSCFATVATTTERYPVSPAWCFDTRRARRSRN